MSKFVVTIFPDETKAYEGMRALKELHSENSIVLYGSAVIAKDSAGAISVKEATDDGPLGGVAVGALIGTLIGLIGGPVGAAVGFAGGAFVGGLRDLSNAGVSASFIQTIADELSPGKTAVVAEIAEDWVTPLDTRMEALGGVVIRTFRTDVEDEQIEKEVAARNAEFEQLKSEYAQATDEAKKKLGASIEKAKGSLADVAKRAREKAESLKEETEAKIATLQQQAKAAASDAPGKFDQRVIALRADCEKRSAKLERAWDLTKEALS